MVSSKRYSPYLRSTVDITVSPLAAPVTSSAVKRRHLDYTVPTVGRTWKQLDRDGLKTKYDMCFEAAALLAFPYILGCKYRKCVRNSERSNHSYRANPVTLQALASLTWKFRGHQLRTDDCTYKI